MSDLEKSRFNGNSPFGTAAVAGLLDKKEMMSNDEMKIQVNTENVRLRFIGDVFTINKNTITVLFMARKKIDFVHANMRVCC